MGRAFSPLNFGGGLFLGLCPRLLWGAPLALIGSPQVSFGADRVPLRSQVAGFRPVSGFTSGFRSQVSGLRFRLLLLQQRLQLRRRVLVVLGDGQAEGFLQHGFGLGLAAGGQELLAEQDAR